MCIYCGTTKYRKIYENHNGSIPTDDSGRSYEIHHIDGNHSNNNPENLQCVSIQQHFELHLVNNDFGACHAIKMRMKSSTDELSSLARNHALAQMQNGTHPFIGINEKRSSDGTHQFLGGEIQRRNAIQRVKDGTHHFLDGSISKKSNADRVARKTHHFLSGEIQTAANLKRVSEGSHPSQKKITCPHCNKTVDSANYSRWHGPKCKFNGNR